MCTPPVLSSEGLVSKALCVMSDAALCIVRDACKRSFLFVVTFRNGRDAWGERTTAREKPLHLLLSLVNKTGCGLSVVDAVLQ